jgi:uncharacterized protein with ParB-like and HNH nuclease domain
MAITEYHEETIADVIARIDSNQIFLPALQRKFVWKTEQIESLFDSIMQGFPIGTFLFWELNDRKTIDDYVFYEFVDHYHERKSRNEQAILSGKKKIISILDGQQRLTSMNIALRGSYSYKIHRKHSSNPDAYPKRYLYLNLIPRQDEDFEYEFKFLTEEEVQKTDESHVWYLVNKVLNWNSSSDLNAQYSGLKETNDRKIITKNRDVIKRTLRTLYKRLCRDSYITHFDLMDKEIDDVLDIFIRVNSGGTKLSRTDLLMSTISASWERARDEVEDLLEDINDKGRKFNFDIDFIMRTCLVLLDLPVLFRVRSFGPETINTIKKKWNLICNAIDETVDLLVDFGFDGLTLTSRNSAIPIVYYVYKQGRTKDQEREELKKYLQHALLTGFFGSHGDQALANLRNFLRKENGQGEFELNKKQFSFDELKSSLSMKGKKLEITEEDINDFLEYKKGRKAFVILSLLYPNLQYNEIKFDQDHIHPAVMFKLRKLRQLGLDENTIERWMEIKDQLPNLQMMEERKNRVKNRTPFKEWLEGKADSEQAAYLTKNYIPVDVSYELTNFDEFFEKRKKTLRNILIDMLID